jgi:hypothetical protein
MPSKRLLFPLALFAAGLSVACGGSGGDSSATPTVTQSAGATARLIAPPFEGPARARVLQREDFRQDADWQMPSPDNLPKPDDTTDPILNPPAPSCPTDWQAIYRTPEGFSVCHPDAWAVDGEGYVSAANQDRWFSVGLFDFTDDSKQHRLAHVSVYAIPPFVEPFRYTIDCPEPKSVTFGGHAAVVCPSFPAVSPEARIISYHVAEGNMDYFVNIVTYFKYDASTGKYTNDTDDDALNMAVQIADTFQLTQTPSTGTATPGPTAP